MHCLDPIALLLICAMCDRPDFLHDATWDTVEEKCGEALNWLGENMYFLVYNENREAYVVDEARKAAGERVDQRLQLWHKPIPSP